MTAAKLSSVRVNAATRIPIPAQVSDVSKIPASRRIVHLRAQKAEQTQQYHQ
jgi:hypothetical protein